MKHPFAHWRGEELPAQTTIEFAFCFFAFIMVVLSIFEFAIECYQRSCIDYQLTIAPPFADVPAKGGDVDEAVRELLCSGTPLDPTLMDVSGASVKLLDQNRTVLGDPTAVKLGSDMSTKTARFIEVDADVSYPVGIRLLGEKHYSRHVTKTIAIERRFEIS